MSAKETSKSNKVSVSTKSDGTKTVKVGGKIKTNLPSDKTLQGPTSASEAPKKAAKKIVKEKTAATSKDYEDEYQAYALKIFDDLNTAIVSGVTSRQTLNNLFFHAYQIRDVTGHGYGQLNIYKKIVAKAKESGASQESIDKILDYSIENNKLFVLDLIHNKDTTQEVFSKLIDYPAKRKNDIFGYDNGMPLNHLAADPRLSIENMKRLLDKYADKREDDDNVVQGIMHNPSVTKEVLKYMLDMDYPGDALERAYKDIPNHRLMDAELMKDYVAFVMDDESYLLRVVGNQFLEEEDLNKLFKKILRFDHSGRKVYDLEKHVEWLLSGYGKKPLPAYFTKGNLKKMIAPYRKDSNYTIWGTLRD